jgi:hypothetical protein
MDDDEEAGLRAFALNVGVGTGPIESARPLWVEVERERVDVTSVQAEWQEDERRGLRVLLVDGSTWLLYYVPDLDLWSGVADAGAGFEPVTTRR